MIASVWRVSRCFRRCRQAARCEAGNRDSGGGEAVVTSARGHCLPAAGKAPLAADQPAAGRRQAVAHFLCVVVFAVAAATGGRAFAQAVLGWRPPPETIAVDFSAKNAERRLVFRDDGMAFEVPCRFVMVGHDRVRVEAELPEAGEFKAEQANRDAQVEVKTLPVQGKRAAVEVVSKLKSLGPEELKRRVQQVLDEVLGPAEKEVQPETAKMNRKQYRKYLDDNEIRLPPPAKSKEDEERALREAFVKARTIEIAQPKIREKLSELADARPSWVTPQDQAAYRKLRKRALLDAWEDLVACDVMDKHLQNVGMGVETNRANFRNRLIARSTALHLVLSGKAGSGEAEAAAIAKGLTSDEQNRLRRLLGVELLCRFYPAVDPKDPNGQWRHGQRVGCKARGVASIRLEGRLDPKQHDRADWWILDGYEPQAVLIQWTRGQGFAVDPPYSDAQGTKLRVVATGDEPVDYAVELRPARPGAGEMKVVVPETLNLLDRKFPY